MDSNKFILCGFADEADPMIDGQIEALKANGATLLEIRGVDNRNIAKVTPDQARELRKKFDENGISVWSLGSPIGKIYINDNFDDELARYRNLLEVGNILGAKCVRLFSFYGTGGKDEYFDAVCERVSKYVEIANEYGIIPCHENEKGIYGEMAAQCLALHKAIPGLKAVFDPANFVQAGQDTKEAWDMLEEYVYYAHIKDANEDGKVVPPGYGCANIDYILPRFAAKGCKVLTVEPHLTEFIGLSALEEDGAKSDVGSVMSFENGREAFDFAMNSLKDVIKAI